MRTDDLRAVIERGRKDPIWWLEKILGIKLLPHQKALVLKTFQSRKSKHCWVTCHSATKSYILAAYCLWFLFCWPGSKVLTSAPTMSQLEQILWAEMRGMLRKSKFDLGGKLLPKACELIIQPEWYMVGLNAQIPEAFQGRKAKKLLIVIDEATGVRDPFFEALLGNMASGEAMIILASNPTRATGQVARCFQPQSFEVWETTQIDAFDTPNFAGIRDEFLDPSTSFERKVQLLHQADIDCPVPFMVRPRWAADILYEFGEDSDVWRVRVRGQFPKGDPSQLVSIGDHLDAVARWQAVNRMSDEAASEAASKGKPFPWWRFRHLLSACPQGGLDVARLGGASSVLSAQANLVSMPQITYPPSRTTELSRAVAEDVGLFGIDSLVVDEPGVGGGPCDQLPEMIAGVIPFNGGKAANDPKHYVNLRAEQFWALRTLYQQGALYAPPGDLLTGQITAIRYGFDAQNRRRVETKDEMAARGVRRFDHADSHMQSFCQVPGFYLHLGAQTITQLNF